MAMKCSLDRIPTTDSFWSDLQKKLTDCKISNLPTDPQEFKKYIGPFIVESIEKIKEQFQQFLEKITTSEFGHSKAFACCAPFNPSFSIKVTTCFRGEEWPVRDRTLCVFTKALISAGSKSIKQEIMVGNTCIQFEGGVDREWFQLVWHMEEMLSAKQQEVAQKKLDSFLAPYEG